MRVKINGVTRDVTPADLACFDTPGIIERWMPAPVSAVEYGEHFDINTQIAERVHLKSFVVFLGRQIEFTHPSEATEHDVRRWWAQIRDEAAGDLGLGPNIPAYLRTTPQGFFARRLDAQVAA